MEISANRRLVLLRNVFANVAIDKVDEEDWYLLLDYRSFTYSAIA